MRTSREVGTLAARLFEAFESATPVPPLTQTEPGLDAAEAYEVQRALVRLHEGAGRRVVARKVGLTSKTIQAQMNVDQPDYGVILRDFVFESGAKLSKSEHGMVAPRIEGELAFVLEEELRGPGVDADGVLAATRAVVPTVEVIDSRVEGWRIKLADTIADNASGWGLVLGEPVALPPSLDLATVGMVLERDGEALATGAGASVLGHPARAVAWLANKMAEYGESLPAGEPILSGSLTAAVDAAPGLYRVRFGDGLGAVEVTITE